MTQDEYVHAYVADDKKIWATSQNTLRSSAYSGESMN